MAKASSTPFWNREGRKIWAIKPMIPHFAPKTTHQDNKSPLCLS
jgi:hypothetical protein